MSASPATSIEQVAPVLSDAAEDGGEVGVEVAGQLLQPTGARLSERLRHGSEAADVDEQHTAGQGEGPGERRIGGGESEGRVGPRRLGLRLLVTPVDEAHEEGGSEGEEEGEGHGGHGGWRRHRGEGTGWDEVGEQTMLESHGVDIDRQRIASSLVAHLSDPIAHRRPCPTWCVPVCFSSCGRPDGRRSSTAPDDRERSHPLPGGDPTTMTASPSVQYSRYSTHDCTVRVQCC